MSDKLPNRKKIRFENYDYSDFGVYYITVCTKDKQKIFWTNKTFSAYKVLGDAGISVGVVLQPPPVAEKGSKALSEITSNRQCIYAQRIADYISDGKILSARLMNFSVHLQLSDNMFIRRCLKYTGIILSYLLILLQLCRIIFTCYCESII